MRDMPPPLSVHPVCCDRWRTNPLSREQSGRNCAKGVLHIATLVRTKKKTVYQKKDLSCIMYMYQTCYLISGKIFVLAVAGLAQIRFSFPSSANFDAQISQLAGQISKINRLTFFTFPSYDRQICETFLRRWGRPCPISLTLYKLYCKLRL